MNDAHKKQCVDRRNMPGHRTSIYHELMCVCVVAMKKVSAKISTLHEMMMHVCSPWS